MSSSSRSLLPILGMAVAATATTLLTVLYLKKQKEEKAKTSGEGSAKDEVPKGENAAYMTNDRGLLLSSVDEKAKDAGETKEETNPLVNWWKDVTNKNNKPKNESEEIFRDKKDAGKEAGEAVNPKDSFEQVDKPSDDEAEVEKKPFWANLMPKKEPPKVEIPDEPKPEEAKEHLSLWDSISSGFGNKHDETPGSPKAAEDEKKKGSDGHEEKKKGFFGLGGSPTKETEGKPEDDEKPPSRKSFFGFGGSPAKKGPDEDATEETKTAAEGRGDISKQNSIRNFWGLGQKPADEKPKEEKVETPKSPARRKIFGFDINQKDPAKDEDKKKEMDESDKNKPKRQSFMDAFLHPGGNEKAAPVDVTDSTEGSSEIKTA